MKADDNEFLFQSGLWLGEGKISFSSSHEFLKFYTKWEVAENSPGVFTAFQIVEIQDVDEQAFNTYIIEDIELESFKVTLENAAVGSVTGKGLRDGKVIAWEFKGHETLEGFEVYEKQENGDYFFHGEYGGTDQFRTIIEGIVWRKTLLLR